ncbi:MAG: acetylglutamate kinase [Methylacidiphilales bacterium]|nr:acetylglutamate kinase [Candidatus Methylacidiphilales bacterium]MDW8349999.1 acetylglutamate kinase [Verrucomicrobiae bacterium]
MNNQHDQVAKALIEALPALLRLKGEIVVVKYGGSAMENERLVEGVLRDVILLAAVGIFPVVVHGGGKLISKAMREANLQPVFIQGMRYTDEATIKIIEKTFNESITPVIANRIVELGAKACAISGVEVLKARKLFVKLPMTKGKAKDSPQEPIDLGLVGEVTEVKTAVITACIRRGEIPVISPIAVDKQGQRYNVNADVAASAVAEALKANTLIFLSDVNGVLRNASDPNSRIPVLTEKQIADLCKQGVIDGGMLPKLDSAMAAIRAGVKNVYLLDGRMPHGLLLKLFTRADVGTEIHI